MREPEPARPGSPITRERHWNPMLDLLRRCRIITPVGSGLGSSETPAGTLLWIEGRDDLVIKITSVSSGAYAWTAQRATAGGGWSDLPGPSGTTAVDPAREANGTAAATPQIVRAWREPDGQLRFVADACP